MRSHLRLVEKRPRPNLYVVPRRETQEKLDVGDVPGVVMGVVVTALAMGIFYVLLEVMS